MSNVKKIRLSKSSLKNGVNERIERKFSPKEEKSNDYKSLMKQQHEHEGEDNSIEYLYIDELNKKPISDLVTLAKSMNLEMKEELTKQRIIYKIIEKSVFNRNTKVIAQGVLEKMQEGYGFLRSPEYNYLSGPDDIYLSPTQIRIFGLRTGDTVMGEIRHPKPTEKYFAMMQVTHINFTKVKKMKERVSFDSLTPSYPQERLDMEKNSNDLSNRFIDLFAPIGKGQRGIIVSPPKAGKTTILKKVANAVARNHPECYIIVLLIDERPEEVTDMKQSVNAEVISSTFDEPATRHVNVAKMALEKSKRLVEQKINVVILLDSLTRLARAYNQVEPTSGKILSGGVDANALHKPKRFFGAARNIIEGGSLTIVATTLIETGSKMDEVIFEEFKGTGNMELVLSRKISERRLFPAIDIRKSGTRKEELLLSDAEIQKTFALRNVLASLDEVEALELVLEKMKMTKNNEHFLKAMNSSS